MVQPFSPNWHRAWSGNDATLMLLNNIIVEQ